MSKLMAGFSILVFLTIITVQAEVTSKTLEYKQGDVSLIGYLAMPEDTAEPGPGILVVPEWKGLNDYAKKRAEQLAELGYVALAADIYGEGKVVTSNEEAGKLAKTYKDDRDLLRARVNAGLDALKAQSAVNPEKVAAIGYCFGGTAVLELARSGADVNGVVSFHGGLDTPTPDDSKNIKAKVLVLHGGDDPYVPSEQVQAFKDEMRQGNVDWQFITYGGAVHSFTNPASGNDPSQGAAYDAAADQRSWQHMQLFFQELLSDAP
jgi:dienelactone hydrolase